MHLLGRPGFAALVVLPALALPVAPVAAQSGSAVSVPDPGGAPPPPVRAVPGKRTSPTAATATAWAPPPVAGAAIAEPEPLVPPQPPVLPVAEPDPQPVADPYGGPLPPDPPEPPAPEAAIVPGIEDALPDAGKASADPATTLPVGARGQSAVEVPRQPSAPSNADQGSAIALPAGSGAVDSTTAQRMVERLVELHLLGSPAEAQDPALFAEAIKAFQARSGIAATGFLDRDTIGLLATQ